MRAAAAGETGRLLFLAMELAWIAALVRAVETALAAPMRLGLLPALLLYPAGWALGRVVRGRGGTRLFELACATVPAALLLAGQAALGLPTLFRSASWAAPSPLDLPSLPIAQALLALLLTGGLAWLRGWMVAGRLVDLAGFAQGFQLGLVVMLLLAWAGVLLPLPAQAFLPQAPVFLLLGLVGLWHARTTSERDEAAGTLPAARPGMALLALLAVTLVGLGLALLVDRAAIEAMLALPLWLARRLGELLAWLASLLPAAEGTLELPPAPDPIVLPPRPPEPSLRLSELVRKVAEWVFLATLIALFAIILFNNLRDLLAWLRARGRSSPGLVRGRSRFGLRTTLHELWLGLRAVLAELRARLARRMGAWRHRRRRAPVARLWRRLERRLERRGWPRAAHETAEEYRCRLALVWPGDGRDLALLARLVATERYGPEPVDPAPALAAWRRLRPTLRRVRAADA